MSGVGEECKASGPQSSGNLGDHIRAGQDEDDPEPPPVGRSIDPGSKVRMRVGHAIGVYVAFGEPDKPRTAKPAPGRTPFSKR
jgi:hypothetical protein